MSIDASTLAIGLVVVAALGTLCSTLAAALAPSSPRAAMVLRVLAAVLVDLRGAVLSAQAQAPAPQVSAPKMPPLPVLLALLALAGCTPSQAATAKTAIDITGSVAADVSDVAKLVADILANLPKGGRVLTADDLAPISFPVRGVGVTLPRWQADAVRAKLAGK